MSEPTKPEEKVAPVIPDTYRIEPDAVPISSKASVKLGKAALEYEVKVGMLPVKDALGETKAGMFYTAYTVNSDKPRPLTFTFNGGPGSSSVWLHLGALGPKRVKLGAEGEMPAPPYDLIDNPETWLAFTDLVFIDPIGTGFSRAVKKDDEGSFWGLEGDIDSIANFIKLYLTRNDRWGSSLFVTGESYGTTRAAGLSDELLKSGVALTGIVLVSSILNFQTARFNKGNDIPYPLFLPSYTATAWYHKCLPADLQRLPLLEVLAKAETFATNEYSRALEAGDTLSAPKRQNIARVLSRLTGLSQEYILLSDLRIGIHRFCKELLRRERRTVGRLDSRYKGIDSSGVNETPDHDPASAALLPPYTHTMNDYVRRVLGYKTDMPYYISNPDGLWQKWKWGDAGKGHPDTSEALRRSLSNNPFMRVFVASGYYDLATPYFATEYTARHLGLDPSLRDHLEFGFYESGHMMYVHESYLAKLRADVESFYSRTQTG